MPTPIQRSPRGCKRQQGFTILELAIATVVLLVGIISVMQLVPASIQSNSNNRKDTMATVIAQRMLEQMALQPLTSTSFVDSDGNTLNLGSGTAGLAGSPLVSGSAKIDFAQAPVTGYNLSYIDPNNTKSGTYDVRWAVITITNGAGIPAAKRLIVGVRELGITGLPLVVSLDTTVER